MATGPAPQRPPVREARVGQCAVTRLPRGDTVITITDGRFLALDARQTTDLELALAAVRGGTP